MCRLYTISNYDMQMIDYRVYIYIQTNFSLLCVWYKFHLKFLESVNLLFRLFQVDPVSTHEAAIFIVGERALEP